VDALITEPYRVDQPTDLVWRGSANQRLVPLTRLGWVRYAAYLTARSDRPAVQVAVDGDRFYVVGVPRRGDLARLERLLAARGIRLKGVSWRP
jgi:anaerobic ribonucleoside-triphosphate reductase activating protein